MNALNNFIQVSPGFKTAVALKNDLDDLDKVAAFIPTEVAKEVIIDLVKKCSLTSGDLRARIIMGTYGTGKSHLALVLLNLLRQQPHTAALQRVLEKVGQDVKILFEQTKKSCVPKPFLVVNLYGNAGHVQDALIAGLHAALKQVELDNLMPDSAFQSALARIDELEKRFGYNFTILQNELSERNVTITELREKLRNYQQAAYDLFITVHPLCSAGSKFKYSTMLTASSFYKSVNQKLCAEHGYSGIAIFWDEFGQKMEEVVKDPLGKEGLALQEFAEYANNSGKEQIHFYILCHRSLQEYHEISRNIDSNFEQLKDDLRKIEGRFKQFIMKSSDDEIFELINNVIIPDKQHPLWLTLFEQHKQYFEQTLHKTFTIKYYPGFSESNLDKIIVQGTYPLHPMATFCLPAISEKVAQNSRTLFTCLCEDSPGSFKRFLDRATWDSSAALPPSYTVDKLWDYFAEDVRHQDKTKSIYSDFIKLSARLSSDDLLGIRILKAVSVFKVVNSTRFKVNIEVLAYCLNLYSTTEQSELYSSLEQYADPRNENRILMKASDNSFRLAVSSTTISLQEKIAQHIQAGSLGRTPVHYLKTLLNSFSVSTTCEATAYFDEYGVRRVLNIEPISIKQLQDSISKLTENFGKGTYQDGSIFIVFCESTHEINEAINYIQNELNKFEYRQMIFAIPKNAINIFSLLREHQSLTYLSNNEPSLYGANGEAYEEWKAWEEDKHQAIKAIIQGIFSPELQLLTYFWKGESQNIINVRQLKALATEMMKDVFPLTPFVGEIKLSDDDLSGNWGLKTNVRAIIQKLTLQDGPELLWKETDAATKQVIESFIKKNGFLTCPTGGEPVILKPEQSEAGKTVWELVEQEIAKAKKNPVNMVNIVKKLRSSPYGIKLRIMPLLFALITHKDLSLGHICFEYQRNPTQKAERITKLEADTLDKIFINPDKYKLTYVNVSSQQDTLIKGLANVYQVKFVSTDLPLEKVKKVGETIGSWWRALPQHVHHTKTLTDETLLLCNTVFQNLAQPSSEVEKILLKDIFEIIYIEDSKKLEEKSVIRTFASAKCECETAIERLQQKIFQEYLNVFKHDDLNHTLKQWFLSLPTANQQYVFTADSGILIDLCRANSELTPDILLHYAEKFLSMSIEKWDDASTTKFGARLEAAKQAIETFSPAPIVAPLSPNPDPVAAAPGYMQISVCLEHTPKTRSFRKEETLTGNANMLANMLDSTIEQLGRGLSETEKATILVEFINKHLFGGQL